MQCEIKAVIAKMHGGSAQRCQSDGKTRAGISTVMCDDHYEMWKNGKRMDLVEGRRKTRTPGVCVTDGRVIVSGWANDFIRAYASERDIPIKKLIGAILEGWAMRLMSGNAVDPPENHHPAGATHPE